MNLNLSNFKYKKNTIIFLLVNIIVFIISISIYHWILNLKKTYINGGLININITFNSGISWSMFSNSVVFVVIIQLLFNIAIIWFIFYIKNGYIIATLSFISAGGLFNIFDRLTNFYVKNMDHHKYLEVLDYLQFGSFLSWFKPIFNIPDLFICCATFILFILIGIEIFKSGDNINDVNLFFDGSGAYLNICIFKDNKIIKKKQIKTNNNLTDTLVEKIGSIINNNFSTIKNIYIVKGPGSFTGTRMNVLVANTIVNINKSIIIYTIDSLTLQSSSDCISIIDARSNKYFYAIYKKNKKNSEILIDTKSSIERISATKKLPIIEYDEKIWTQNFLKHINSFVKEDKVIPLYIKEPGINTN